MSESSQNKNYRMPGELTMKHAAMKACEEDKPIMMDYWTLSLDGSVLIGVRNNKEKLLVKNEEEYTSPIVKIFKVNEDYLIMTENSIYIVDSKTPNRNIS